MLDLKFIRDNTDVVNQSIARRGLSNADAGRVVELYQHRNEIQQRLEALRSERNENSQKMKAKLEPEERQALIDRGRELKEQIALVEAEIEQVGDKLELAARAIPNLIHPDVPTGGEGDGRVIETVGAAPALQGEARDHLEIGMALDLIDFDSAAKVSGAKFYYLKNEGALLELALINFAIGKLVARGWKIGRAHV